MKIIEVSAAMIVENNKFLITKRIGGDFDGLWEFPGGKIEETETPEQTVVREILEELDINIKVDSHYISIEYAYPKFNLHMHIYKCSISSGSITLNDHSDFAWISKEEVNNFEWVPADIEIINKIRKSNTL